MAGLGWILWLIVGGLAGLISGKLMRGEGFGLFGNIVVGVVGGWFGGWILPVNTQSGSFWGSLITAIIGAVILQWIVSLITRNR